MHFLLGKEGPATAPVTGWKWVDSQALNVIPCILAASVVGDHLQDPHNNNNNTTTTNNTNNSNS